MGFGRSRDNSWGELRRGRSRTGELEELFHSQNKSTVPGATSIPATYLRVTASVR
ncbi:MAG: hypothetical protein ABL998_05215 [Planctomycetota bacterium]